MVSQRTKCGPKYHVTDHFTTPSDKMTGRKRLAAAPRSTSLSSSETETKKSKRQVSVATFEKWQRQFNRDHQTLTWLRCEKDKCDKSHVAYLWCSACRQFEEKYLLNEELLQCMGDWDRESADKQHLGSRSL